MSPATRLLIGGFLTLALVMGVGRFLYTPLLPLMQAEAGFGAATAGLIGSANFAGYLAGAVAVSFVRSGRLRLRLFRAAIVVSAATTLAMGLTGDLALWLALRAAGGAASAVAMLTAAAIVAEALARVDEPGRVGWLFGGVGFGIALSGLFVHLAHPPLDSAGLWIAAGLAGLLVVPVILAEMGERRLEPRRRRGAVARRVPRPFPFLPLFANYALEGFGYSIFATFIVAIVKARPGLEATGDFVWVLAGLAGLPSCLAWAWLAERIGFARALLGAYAAQILGVLLPVLSGSGWAALLSAVLFGGTFMAISALTLPLGRHGVGGRGFAILTVGFGVGQMLGPYLGGLMATGPAGFDGALLVSAAVLAIGTLCLAAGMRRRAA